MSWPANSPATPAPRSKPLTLREGHELYGARVRNRVLAGFVSLGLAFWLWTLQARFPRGTTLHIALIWGAAVCFAAAELSWSWARLLWRQWVKGKPFTKTRLRYELAMAVLLALFFGWYVLERMKW